MTDSTLPDGRKVFVGGEHEDFGVPDFYIYNDVILVLPDDSVQIFGYTVEAFPPTDFHSATLNEKTVIPSAPKTPLYGTPDQAFNGAIPGAKIPTRKYVVVNRVPTELTSVLTIAVIKRHFLCMIGKRNMHPQKVQSMSKN
jgi:hypothetical protein